ncbi:MAG: hypothetical protein J1F23_08255 [Oscillospiraceae bacterium]|nr:hypothetical protein [Oscillospiraceae bacterium]
MDILRFIQSRAMREYLEEINYKFNADECAWLVYQCRTAILSEKHAAWKEIIDTMPDHEVISESLSHKSLHKFLKQYMEIENRSIELFFEPMDDAFYQFSWSYVSDNYKPYYKTVDECFSAAIKYHNENDLLSPEEKSNAYIDIFKMYDGDVHEHIKFKPDGKIISTFPSVYSLSEEEFRLYNFFFQCTHFCFLNPFKTGDVLFNARYDDYPNHNLMVFDRIELSETDRLLAYGYVMDDGHIMREGFDCLDLDYYKSEHFEDEYRALDYVRKYLLGELSLTGLMNKYHQIMCEEQAKNTEFHSDLWENDTVDEKWKRNWFFEQTQNI